MEIVARGIFETTADTLPDTARRPLVRSQSAEPDQPVGVPRRCHPHARIDPAPTRGLKRTGANPPTVCRQRDSAALAVPSMNAIPDRGPWTFEIEAAPRSAGNLP